ncbi:MAG TPA: FlgD immunoglobulin-like domain containing protein [Candidatus Krumholzibacteria bacterium]|nr:FlgD immunoglobulin-like domain containing protein [Candidatus Krumholzibacteria bacterium]
MQRRVSLTFILAILLAIPRLAHADFRHFSSRVLESTGLLSGPSIATDAAGDVFVAVNAGGPISFGGDLIGPGYVLAKLDPSGQQMWAFPVVSSPSSNSGATIQSIAATRDGGVVVAGSMWGSVAFPGGMMTAVAYDILLLKFNPDGSPAWQHRYGGNQDQMGEAVVVDGDDNIVLTGANYLTVDFGGGVIRANGAADVFIAKFDAAGGHLWSHGYGDRTNQEGIALAIGPDNRVALVCSAGGEDFGDGVVASPRAVMFDADGVHLWTIESQPVYSEKTRDVAIDDAGNVSVCGNFTVAISNRTGALAPAALRAVGFVASYDLDGTPRWNFMMPDSASSLAERIAVDSAGDCLVLGSSASVFVFADRYVPASSAMMLGFDAAGEPVNASAFGDNVREYRIAVDRAHDRIQLATVISGATDFGGGPLLPSGNYGLALATLGVRRPPQVTISQFGARATESGVKVTWNVESGEPLDAFSLARTQDQDGTAQLLWSRPAGDGVSTYVDDDARPGHRYTYRLTVTTALGDDVVSNAVSVDIPPVLAPVTALEQNAPNPFNPLTTFHYSLAAPAHVRISIYDISGALVATLDQGNQPAGHHQATWGGHNNEGSFVGSGVYFYRLEGAGQVLTRKMILVK